MTKQNFFKLKTIILFVTVFSAEFSLLAETVILRSHEVIHGKITSQDVNVLKMNDDSGKPLELQKNDILKVSYRDVKDAKEIKKIIEEEESKLPPEKRKKVAVPEKRNKYKVTLQSAILPGWGQWKTGNRWLAIVTFVGVFGVVSYTGSKIGEFRNTKTDYKNNISFYNIITLGAINQLGVIPSLGLGFYLGEVNYKPYVEAQNRGNDALRVLGLVYGLQLIHSYILGRAWEKADPNATIGKKAVFGDWNINASPRAAYTPAGVTKETYYEVNYVFQF